MVVIVNLLLCRNMLLAKADDGVIAANKSVIIVFMCQTPRFEIKIRD